MSLSLLPISASSYAVHALHEQGQIWDQTNCSVDAWIEVLHALELDPLAAAAFSVATDHEGDQWSFYKYPAEDLWSVYGIDVHEMNPWRNVLDHICEQLERGRLMTVEVDSWFLPDTHGVSYRLTHTKSTIVVNFVDREERRLGYFHNSGYHELEGDDFDGAFRLGHHADPAALVPYVEIVRLESLRRSDPTTLGDEALALLRVHAARRPQDNPVTRMAERVTHDLTWLPQAGPEAFHAYAFATIRQCGASAETAAAFCTWLAEHHEQLAAPLRASAGEWLALSQHAKAVQLKLARAARGRTVDLSETWAEMAGQWQRAQDHLDDALGS